MLTIMDISDIGEGNSWIPLDLQESKKGEIAGGS